MLCRFGALNSHQNIIKLYMLYTKLKVFLCRMQQTMFEVSFMKALSDLNMSKKLILHVIASENSPVCIKLLHAY